MSFRDEAGDARPTMVHSTEAMHPASQTLEPAAGHTKSRDPKLSAFRQVAAFVSSLLVYAPAILAMLPLIDRSSDRVAAWCWFALALAFLLWAHVARALGNKLPAEASALSGAVELPTASPSDPKAFSLQHEIPLVVCLAVSALAVLAIYALGGRTSDIVAGWLCMGVVVFWLGMGRRVKSYGGGPHPDAETFRDAAKKLELPTSSTNGSAPDISKSAIGVHIELLKLEYQRGIDRYDNLYKSIWLQFSYMAVLSAGIATFSSKVMNVWVVAVFALCPLVFWFFASFLPIDFYGVEARRRLGTIETALTALSFRLLTGDATTKQTGLELFALGHFSEFKKIQYRWHVGQAVRGAFALITVAFIWTGTRAGAYVWQKYGHAAKISPQRLQADSISFVFRLPETKALAESLTAISASVDSIRVYPRNTHATLDSTRARLTKP